MNDNKFLLSDRIAKIKAIDEQYNLKNNAYTGVKHADKLFARADKKLELEGYEVVNPYKFGEHLKKEYAKENKVPAYENYMRGDIELLINCDAIYLLENWGTSKGARLEKKIAEVLKMQIMTD